MTKKWINMLGGMCMAALLFVLSGCGKEDLVGQTDSSAEEGEVVSTVVPVTFHLQGEDLSRALTEVEFERFDVKAYIFQAEKKKASWGSSWDENWNNYNLERYIDITTDKFQIDLVSREKKNAYYHKYQYKVVFLAAPKGSSPKGSSPKGSSPKGSSVLPEPSKGLLGGYDFPYDDALTKQFHWYAEENADNAVYTDNAVYRDVVEIFSNDKDNYDDIAFTSDINNVWVKLYHQDGEFSLNVKQNTLSEGDRVKATKATITIGNVYKKMYLAEKEISVEILGEDEIFYTQCKTDKEDDVQTLEKTFDLNLASGDQSLPIHSLPQYEGITCTIRMHDDADHTYYENSFGTDAGVKIFPNKRTNVSLSATGFDFNIQLEDDKWDGPRQ